ncbi:MAG: hypothetical protein AAGB27_13680 [Pseudomonadota bacterium]
MSITGFGETDSGQRPCYTAEHHNKKANTGIFTSVSAIYPHKPVGWTPADKSPDDKIRAYTPSTHLIPASPVCAPTFSNQDQLARNLLGFRHFHVMSRVPAMKSNPHPTDGCDLAGQGGNSLLLTALAVAVGSAAGLLLVPVFLGILMLAAIPLAASRLTHWLSGEVTSPRAEKTPLTPKF